MIDHLDDLEADFLRFYRIEDIEALDGPRFFRLAWRVSAYGGVMAVRMDAHQDPSTSGRAPAQSRSTSGQHRTVSLDRLVSMFPGSVERVTVPEGAPDG